MASLVESKMTQIGVFWGLLENDDSNRKTERWYLSLEFETHFSSKTDWFDDWNIFQKLGSTFGGILNNRFTKKLEYKSRFRISKATFWCQNRFSTIGLSCKKTFSTER